jgi:hypothetical protein
MDTAVLKTLSFEDLVTMNHNIGMELLLRSRQELIPPPPVTTATPTVPLSSAPAAAAAIWTPPPLFPLPPSDIKILPATTGAQKVTCLLKVLHVCPPNTSRYTSVTEDDGTNVTVETWRIMRQELIDAMETKYISYRISVSVEEGSAKLYFTDTAKARTAYKALKKRYARMVFLENDTE